MDSGRPWALSATVLVVIAVGFTLLLPATTGPGSEMDEGAVLAYASRINESALPYRDFETFYGPANPGLVAVSFDVFGRAIGTERAVGVVYRLLILVSVFTIGRGVAGLAGGALAGVLAASILAGELIWAYSAYGAVAFGLLSIALSMLGVGSRVPRRQHVFLLMAGASAGLAVLQRFDFVLPVILGSIPFFVFVRWRPWAWWGAGFILVSGLYVPLLIAVGATKIGRVAADLHASQAGRTLPIPGPGTTTGNVLVCALASVGCVGIVGGVLWAHRSEDRSGHALVAVALFSLGLLPYALSRADIFHIRPFAVAALSLLPALAILLVRSLVRSPQIRMASFILIAVIVGAYIAGNGLVGRSRVETLVHTRSAYRGFVDPADPDAPRAVIERLRRLARPHDSVFVGPHDLRRTNYGPTYLYFLLPELRPASYYMEMNPFTANRAGSGLASELKRADWLILTTRWDNWRESNRSSVFGSAAPNAVVRNLFCVRFERSDYRLYERCDRVDRAQGSSVG